LDPIHKIGKSVRAYCVIDGLTQRLAPACHTSHHQPIPSGGRYTIDFFNCFFRTLLGAGWNTGKAVETGTPTAGAMAAAFTGAFGDCPSFP
jgi:hypothetical protein